MAFLKVLRYTIYHGPTFSNKLPRQYIFIFFFLDSPFKITLHSKINIYKGFNFAQTEENVF
jgi:hypothetical protein